MKKLLGILVISLLWGNISYSNPNNPTKAAAKGTPPSRSIDPKVNLSIASVLSMPTAPINKPIPAAFIAVPINLIPPPPYL